MVESQPSKLLVAGSIPVSRSKDSRAVGSPQSQSAVPVGSHRSPADLTVSRMGWGLMRAQAPDRDQDFNCGLERRTLTADFDCGLGLPTADWDCRLATGDCGLT